jgi:hypothetical protein
VNNYHLINKTILIEEYTKKDKINNKSARVRVYEGINIKNETIVHFAKVLDLNNKREKIKTFYDSESLDDARRWGFENAVQIIYSQRNLY